MLDNTANAFGMEGNLARRPIAEGTTVYDAGGDKVGTVSEHSAQGGYLVVHKGWLFPKDVYVPLNAIGRADADGVYLNMYTDDLKNQNWENPPADAGTLIGSPRGMGDTSDKVMSPDLGAYPDTGPTTPRDDSILSGHPAPVQQSDVAVPIHEEAGAGHIHLHKDAVEEPQSINVPVTREEIRAERVPVEGTRVGDLATDAFQDKDIDVPVMGERVNVEKQARVGEELRLHKREITEQQQYGETVRSERATVEGPDERSNAPLDTTENVDDAPPNYP